MSVAAMTLDDQRPLMNSYDSKISKKYEQNLHIAGATAPPSGPASPTPSGSEEPTAAVHQFHQTHHHHQHHHQQQQQQFHHRHPQPMPEQLQQSQVALLQQTPLIVPIQQQQQQLPTDAAVAAVEQRQRLLEDEIEQLKLEKTRLSTQCNDAQRREKILMRRLANKELEFQDYVSQIAEYKAAQAPSAMALRTALLDPAVNLLFEKLKKELKATKAKLEETQNELSAWKFTPDSNTGKRLMAKCRLLYQENEELGKMTSNGRLSKLATELAMQKSFSEEVKKSQSELDEFLQELDEDVEGMQSTILFLQQELKQTRDRIQTLEKENVQLKNNICEIVPINTCQENATNEDTKLLLQPREPALLNGDDGVINTTILASNNNNTVCNEAEKLSANNELKFIAPPLTPLTVSVLPKLEPAIVDNACLRNTQTRVTEFYGNGSMEQQQLPVVVNNVGNTDEGSNSNSSNCSNNAVPAKLRTAASRKRNYENELIENVAAANTLALTTTNNIVTAATTITTPTPTLMYSATAAPRTLPPKKSKLRRTSVQSLELNDNCSAPAQNLSIISNAVEGLITPVPLSLLTGGIGSDDNAAVVTSIASDDLASVNLNAGAGGVAAGALADVAGVAAETNDDNIDGVAQRILMRRRSTLRPPQQNGSVGDNNH